ncbi:MAG: D-glycero-beta-D-manno-heptose 1,7-bisphosphate 7-phosphatase [Roseiflexaceae bacterium]
MRVVFLDRDGVINENRNDHVKSWDEFQFIPGSLEAIRLLRHAGYYVFVVTNQAIINRGLATRQTLDEIHQRMFVQVTSAGGRIHDLRYCPHDTHEQCTCRKPQPGMLCDLAEQWRIDLNNATLIGDAWTDIQAAQSVGCRTVLVKTGRGLEQLALPIDQHRSVDFIAADLWEAVHWVLQRDSLVLPSLEREAPDSARTRIALATPVCGVR